MISYYENKVIQLCVDYASVAHKGHLRNDRITPYISHPGRGSANVFLLGGSYVSASAFWLHDTMEDCSKIIDGEYSDIINNHPEATKNIKDFLTKNDVIKKVDGIQIYALVDALTMSQNKSIPKKERKIVYYEALLKAWQPALLLKYCDRIDNLTTVHNVSRGGFKHYLEDTQKII